jgi:hydrogenase maturation protein HypF
LLAVDHHPDYISTRLAEKFGLPVTIVQHHHAHIASCMVENGLDEPVIGVAFDGTGLGDDGNSWGSEFMVCDLTEYTRITHFDYMPLPGGDLASEEPWRMAVSWLYRIYGRDCLAMDLPVIRKIGTEKIGMLLHMIERKINCPLTSGAGRLFDAVASLLDLCQVAAFSAQGPMLLEANIKPATSTEKKKILSDRYQYFVGQTINFENTIREIVDDLGAGTSISDICRKFHNTIISVIFETVQTIRRDEGIQKVVLSGGVFQNKYLLEGVEELLKEINFEVFTHSAVPSNDGGIALGQMAVAAKRREKGCV